MADLVFWEHRLEGEPGSMKPFAIMLHSQRSHAWLLRVPPSSVSAVVIVPFLRVVLTSLPPVFPWTFFFFFLALFFVFPFLHLSASGRISQFSPHPLNRTVHLQLLRTLEGGTVRLCLSNKFSK